jgi:hypothetical protein
MLGMPEFSAERKGRDKDKERVKSSCSFTKAIPVTGLGGL